ncbi:RNA polymerase factor sigma-54 [Wansuia hejianensis]|uniref:RNA polymerase factor sigma-54 n=1 Tax=Wansuia hejianensis TaxID=2763667 RepID=A0A926INH2_9FIRM|nr:RNA polymerase factor sigma-54 [Wansuia hejianensis]MBC8591450.1 RNA polymerase factor sigma-54 [Wansuia hejianensis]
MKLGYNLTLEQTQKLIMTPELRQAIQLLQFNSLELNEYIKKEIEENPVLEMEENFNELGKLEELPEEKDIDWKEFIEKYDDISYRPQIDKNHEEHNYESLATYSLSLKDYLIDQLNFINLGDFQYEVGKYIIQSLSPNGYLDYSTDEIASQLKIDTKEVEDVLKIIQSFEPIGVGARNLKECLLIQIRKEKDIDPLVNKIVTDHLEDLAYNRMPKISKELEIDISKIQEACDYIKTLEPKPGRGFGDENTDGVKFIIPDATIELVDGDFVIKINDITGPRLNINNYYKKLIQNNPDKEATAFLTERLNSAIWMIKSIEQRRQTIYKVVESILKHQIGFFKFGKKALLPLTLKEVAEDIDMHESTISRATNGKYVQTPRGLYELKYFFTTGLPGLGGDLSSTSIKATIKDIIGKENPKKPYSDQNISNILKDRGISISRRTVAKYRDELDIPSSSMRKRF